MFGLKLPKGLIALERERRPQRLEIQGIEARYLLWQRWLGSRTNLSARRLVMIERELVMLGFLHNEAIEAVRAAVEDASAAFNTRVEKAMQEKANQGS